MTQPGFDADPTNIPEGERSPETAAAQRVIGQIDQVVKGRESLLQTHDIDPDTGITTETLHSVEGQKGFLLTKMETSGIEDSIVIDLLDDNGQPGTEIAIHEGGNPPHNEVTVDGVPVNNNTELPVEQVIEDIKQELDEQQQKAAEGAETKQDSSEERENKEAAMKRLASFYGGSSGDAMRASLKEVSLQLKTDPNILLDRLKKADINLSPRAASALHAFLDKSPKPDSSVWATSPNAPSQLGAVVKQSRAALTTALREILS